MPRVLVTGSAGFIGAHVVRAALEDGLEVRALHRPGEDLRNLVGLDVERCPGDVTDPDGMRQATRGCEVVFHLAAVFALWAKDGGAHMRRVNVDGTRIVLRAAAEAGARRVVHTSSIARFGGQGPGVRATERSPFRLSGDPYSVSKADSHEVAVELARDLDVVIVAPTGPVGPGDVGPTPTGRLLLDAVRRPAAIVVRGASNVGDVRDFARGHLLAAARGRRGESYLLGGRDVALADLARLARVAVGLSPRVAVVPARVARALARAAVAWSERVSGQAPSFTPAAVDIMALGLEADCAKAVTELGLPVRPIASSVADALAWWAREGHVADDGLRRRILAWTSSM